MRTFYDILGLSEGADQATIRSTYLRLLQIYHPDHNRDSAAGAKTTELIEAYTVLIDPAKRKAYDESLRPTASSSTRTDQAQRAPDAQIEEIVCQVCKVQDESLRVSIMYWVVSLLVITRRGGKAGIWCAKCRVTQAFAWSSVAGFLGWWGVPWGPIYTAHALYFNAVGGKQDRSQNAALLRLVAYQLYQNGNRSQALAAISKSMVFEQDEPSSRFAQSLREMGVTGPASRRIAVWGLMPAIPSLLALLLVVLGISSIESQPSGYAARYEPPISATSTSKSTTTAGTGRSEVNALVDSLGRLCTSSVSTA